MNGIDGAAREHHASSQAAAFSFERPGFIRRTGAGGWYVISGTVFLVRHVSLWLYIPLPALISAFFLAAGLFFGVFLLNTVESRFLPDSVSAAQWPSLTIRIGLWVAALAAAMLAGLALALFFSAPILDRLSRRVERKVRGVAVARPPSLTWELIRSFRGSLYLLGAAPIALVVGLIPFAGPLLAVLWSAFALAFQQTDPILARRGLVFNARRAWHRGWRYESIGFGAAGLLVLPFANVLLGPVLTAGATLLVLEIEEGVVP